MPGVIGLVTPFVRQRCTIEQTPAAERRWVIEKGIEEHDQ